ncbi:ATP-dependent zinc metalloprotease FtsH [Patescibacteria group bacterium]
MSKRWLITLLAWVGLIVTFFLVYSLVSSAGEGRPQDVETHEFEALIDSGEITSLKFEGDGHVLGTRGEGDAATQVRTFTSDREWLREAVRRTERDIEWNEEEIERPGLMENLLVSLLPMVLIIAVLIFFWRMKMKGPGGGIADRIGRAKAKVIEGEPPETRFTDVGGAEEAVDDVKDIVAYLKDPTRYQDTGATPPKGVLLTGPPGTGKTHLARAIAGESGVPFFVANGSEFVEMFVGVGASRVRDLFEKARAKAPCIIFIDEIDGVAGKRGGVARGSHEEREQTLNQLLVELDGFGENTNVVVIAATNRPDMLDSGLTRAGRFDRKVFLAKPTVIGREEIFDIHIAKRGIVLQDDITSKLLAQRTWGMTGADIESLLNEAALRAAKEGRGQVTTADIDYAIDKVQLGPERKSIKMTDEQKLQTSYHEMGHVFAMHLDPHGETFIKATCTPRSRSLGVTQGVDEEELYALTSAQVVARIRAFLGGRAAEFLHMGDTTTGCSNDLDRATAFAKNMVMRWGMGKGRIRTYGQVDDSSYIGESYFQRDYGEQAAAEIDSAVKAILDQCWEETVALLSEHRKELDELSQLLFEQEVIDRSDVEDVIGPKNPDRTPPEEE